MYCKLIYQIENKFFCIVLNFDNQTVYTRYTITAFLIHHYTIPLHHATATIAPYSIHNYTMHVFWKFTPYKGCSIV